MRRILGVLILAVGVGVAAWLLWPRAPVDDEAAIRAVISEMAKSASDRDVGAVMEHVSERYKGVGGSKDELKGYLLGWTLRSQNLSAVPAKVDVELAGDTAHVKLVVVLARGGVGAAEGAETGSRHIEADFAREGSEWRVVHATHREAGLGDWLPGGD